MKDNIFEVMKEKDLTRSTIEGLLVNWEWNDKVNTEKLSNFDEDDQLSEEFDRFEKEFNVPKTVMDNGILWVWTPKRLISQMIDLMATHKFVYVENIVVCQQKNPCGSEFTKNVTGSKIDDESKENFSNENVLGKRAQPSIKNFFGAMSLNVIKKPFGQIAANSTVTETIKTEIINDKAINEPIKENFVPVNGKINFGRLPNFNVEEIMMNNKGNNFNTTKLTLLMFRRHHKSQSLELRHQRNPDCFFDIYFEGQINGMDDIGKERIYKTIETLLPKAMGDKPDQLRLMEQNGTKPRPGWVTVCKNN